MRDSQLVPLMSISTDPDRNKPSFPFPLPILVSPYPLRNTSYQYIRVLLKLKRTCNKILITPPLKHSSFHAHQVLNQTSALAPYKAYHQPPHGQKRQKQDISTGSHKSKKSWENEICIQRRHTPPPPHRGLHFFSHFYLCAGPYRCAPLY